jgi:hypothetical protein
MLKEWYMKTPEGSIGPLERQDLLKRISMAPDTLVRKADEKKWTPAFAHPDLKPYLKPVKPQAIDEEEESQENPLLSEVLVCENSRQSLPPNLERWLIWAILALLIFLAVKISFE